MRPQIGRFVVLTVVALAAPALAAPPGGYQEIERGLFLGLSAGPSFLKPPASSGPRPFSSGQTAAIELGVDLTPMLSLSVFLQGTAQRVGAEYIGDSGGTASGDFSELVPGAALRFKAVGLADSQGVRRTWLYLRGGLGLATFTPKALLPDADILVFAGPGLEYYTRLRHFSIGVELVGTFLAKSKAFGFALTPTLRYAF